MSPSHIHQQGGIMVAVRGSHLSNPHDFEIEQWCSSLKLTAPVEKSLIDAWYYAQAKIAEHADQMENAIRYAIPLSSKQNCRLGANSGTFWS